MCRQICTQPQTVPDPLDTYKQDPIGAHARDHRVGIVCQPTQLQKHRVFTGKSSGHNRQRVLTCNGWLVCGDYKRDPTKCKESLVGTPLPAKEPEDLFFTQPRRTGRSSWVKSLIFCCFQLVHKLCCPIKPRCLPAALWDRLLFHRVLRSHPLLRHLRVRAGHDRPWG